MAKRILITGMTGFAGSFLAEHLLKIGENNIVGTYLLDESLRNIKAIQNKIETVQIDLTNEQAVSSLIARSKPEIIFHLAALPAVGGSFANPAGTISNNVIVQVHLLEAVKNANLLSTKILIISSSDVYGEVEEKDLPIDEETAFRPTNAYAVSKITQDYLGLQYFLSYAMRVVRVRPFNHIGPRQSTGFAIADWAKKIAMIEKKKMEPVLIVGDLETKRDFTDVRDMVKAYTLALEKGVSGDVYNIGSGVSHRVGDVLNMLLKFAKIRIAVTSDPNLFRPQDFGERVCDNKKFVRLTGWKPTILLEKTLEETLDYWRNIV